MVLFFLSLSRIMPFRRTTRATPLPTTEETPRVETVPNNELVANHATDLKMIEDFGRDKDLKALLGSLQPKSFTGEGGDTPKILEEWIMSMEDYFSLAKYNPLAQRIMGKAKLEGSAKIW